MHCIGTESFGKMKNAKNQKIQDRFWIVWREHKHDAHLYIIKCMLLSNSDCYRFQSVWLPKNQSRFLPKNLPKYKFIMKMTG